MKETKKHQLVPALQGFTATALSIVIIEDDHDDTEFLCDSFKEVIPAAHVVCFSNAAKAVPYLLELRENEVPSVIVLDYNLPITTGLELLKQLNNNPVFNKTAKVIYSHSANPKDKEECLQAGAHAYIQKGCTFEQMKDDARQMLTFCNRSN